MGRTMVLSDSLDSGACLGYSWYEQWCLNLDKSRAAKNSDFVRVVGFLLRFILTRMDIHVIWIFVGRVRAGHLRFRRGYWVRTAYQELVLHG